jgi:hypothetical protein
MADLVDTSQGVGAHAAGARIARGGIPAQARALGIDVGVSYLAADSARGSGIGYALIRDARRCQCRRPRLTLTRSMQRWMNRRSVAPVDRCTHLLRRRFSRGHGASRHFWRDCGRRAAPGRSKADD